MFGSKKGFRFSLVRFQPSLFEKEGIEDVAVIVEGDDLVIFLGKRGSRLEDLSDMGRSFLEKLPDTLKLLTREASEAGRTNVLEWLRQNNRWNVFLTEPEVVKADAPIEQVAVWLFAKHILRVHEAVAVPSLVGGAAAQEEIFWGGIDTSARADASLHA